MRYINSCSFGGSQHSRLDRDKMPERAVGALVPPQSGLELHLHTLCTAMFLPLGTEFEEVPTSYRCCQQGWALTSKLTNRLNICVHTSNKQGPRWIQLEVVGTYCTYSTTMYCLPLAPRASMYLLQVPTFNTLMVTCSRLLSNNHASKRLLVGIQVPSRSKACRVAVALLQGI